MPRDRHLTPEEKELVAHEVAENIVKSMGLDPAEIKDLDYDDVKQQIYDMLSAEGVQDPDIEDLLDVIRWLQPEWAEEPFEDADDGAEVTDVNDDGDEDVVVSDTTGDGKKDTAVIAADDDKELDKAAGKAASELDVPKKAITSAASTSSTSVGPVDDEDPVLSDSTKKNIVRALADLTF